MREGEHMGREGSEGGGGGWVGVEHTQPLQV